MLIVPHVTKEIHRETAQIDCTSPIDRFSRFPDRLRLATGLDAEALSIELAQLERAIWTRHFVTENYVGDWSVLPLRAPKGADHPLLRITSHPGETRWADTEYLPPTSAFRHILSQLCSSYDAVRLMRLGPGSHIAEHRDPDLAPEFGAARLHVPIRTNERVTFRLNGSVVPMATGELWYVRLSDPHSVTNDGLTDRVHLVIDCRMTEGLERLFERALLARR